MMRTGAPTLVLEEGGWAGEKTGGWSVEGVEVGWLWAEPTDVSIVSVGRVIYIVLA